MKNKGKRGISLIVLIITIVVVVILAVAVILTISKNNPVDSAQKAVFLSDVGSYQDELSLYIAKQYVKESGNFNVSSLDGKKLEEVIEIKEKYNEKFVIENGKLVGTDKLTEKEKEWFEGEVTKVEEEIKKVTDTTPGVMSGSGSSEEPYLVESIEDLVALSNNTNSGTSYEGKYIKLKQSLDFNNDISYVDPNTTVYGDINGDGNVEGLKIELTKRTERTGEYKDGFVAIGTAEKAFKGSFDGNNKKIMNMYIKDTTNKAGVTSPIGLFGVVDYTTNTQGKIENIQVSGEVLRMSKNSTTTLSAVLFRTGGIIGQINKGSVENCINDVKIIEANEKNCEVGGIIGTTEYTNIISCTNNANISGNDCCLGGIVGISIPGPVEIKGCTNNGILSANKGDVGGIVAIVYDGVTIDNCINLGSIEMITSGDTGGIAGDANYCNVNNSVNKASVKGINNVGGIVGFSSEVVGINNCINEGYTKGQTEVGGIVGHAWMLKNSSNYRNTGKVEGNEGVGGVFGYLGSAEDTTNYSYPIVNAYNNGEVIGNNKVGGIIGSTESSDINIYNIYNSGTVRGQDNVGGIAGYFGGGNGFKLINAYNVGDINGVNKVGGIFGGGDSDSTVYDLILNNVYSIGSITGTTSTGAVIGVLMDVLDTYDVKEVYYKANIGAVNGGAKDGMVQKEVSANELMQSLNNKANEINATTPNIKYLEWIVKPEVNNGYPVFK